MKTVTIALVILSLASLGTCLNWEYAGNWSTSNTTAIDSAILTTMTASKDVADAVYGYNLGRFTKKLSENLEATQGWAQFWNVFLIVQDAANDAVVYGYAFNKHWLWKNNIQFTGLATAITKPSGKIFGLVLWKDYNCQMRVYKEDGEYTACTFSQGIIDALSTAIKADTKPRLIADPWATAFNIVQAVQKYATTTVIGGANRAYSAVLSQDKAAKFYGALCHATDGGFSISPNLDFGTLFLFQTRDYANAPPPA